jgi:hypothetical protein
LLKSAMAQVSLMPRSMVLRSNRISGLRAERHASAAARRARHAENPTRRRGGAEETRRRIESSEPRSNYQSLPEGGDGLGGEIPGAGHGRHEKD